MTRWRAAAPPSPAASSSTRGIAGLRFAVADGHFARGGEPAALAAVGAVAEALGARDTVTLPEAHRARAAAMIITAAEGAQLHLPDLRSRPEEFDPLTRDRFLAGALLPATAYVAAQRFRAWYRARVAELFEGIDVHSRAHHAVRGAPHRPGADHGGGGGGPACDRRSDSIPSRCPSSGCP